jgi:hypothetical protein
MEKSYEGYKREVEVRRKDGSLRQYTVRTYLTHAWDFIRWCKGEFMPGVRKLKKR